MRRLSAVVIAIMLTGLVVVVGAPFGAGPDGATFGEAAEAGASAPARTPARPRRMRARPHLAVPTQTPTRVVFRGASRPKRVVRLQVRSGSSWKRVRLSRANRRGKFQIAVPKARQTQTYRVRSFARASVQRTVVPTFDACGDRPLKEDGSLYSCTLFDGFDGTALNTKLWMRQSVANWGNQCISPDPRLSFVANGSLWLNVVKTSGNLVCPSSGLFRARYAASTVTTHGRFSQQFGRFEARMKVSPVTTTQGLHGAFWLWPDARYGPAITGRNRREIDIAELYSSEPDLSIPFLHYPGGNDPMDGINTAWACTAHRGLWNTYTLDWTPTKVVIKVNGATCLTSYQAAPYFHQRFIINLSQYLGTGTNNFNGRAPLPGTTQVDYVKVWR